MNKELWNINILKSLKNLETLRDIFTKSPESSKRYKAVITDFGSLFSSLSGGMPDSGYKRYAEEINTKTSKYNDEGDNFKLKQNASLFANRILNLDWSEAALFISELNTKDNVRFLSMLKENGVFVDRVEEQRKKKEEEDERRRREEEERRKREESERRRREEEERRKREESERRRREEEERRKREEEERKRKEAEANKPKMYYVSYCTNCGTKFSPDGFKYCTQCGAKRHIFQQ